MWQQERKEEAEKVIIIPYPSEHAVRVKDPGDFEPDSFRSKEIGKEGVRIIMGKLKGKKSMEVQAYRFPQESFDMKQVDKWLKDNGVEDYIKIEEAKKSDASGEPSIEYLKAFHRFVTGHPHINGLVKEEIHKRSRGSAGGQRKALKAQEEEITLEDIMEHPLDEGSVKVTNAAQMQGDYIETDEYIDAPTVFAKEGVFTGTNGVPTKKVYEVLKANVPRFLGASATPDHIETDTLRPSDRWLGHAVNVTARDDKRDVFGYTRYYKNSLTSDELEKIKNKQYPDGSIGYFTETKPESGVFNGEPYEAVEVGPYIISEYATFFNGTKGACSREMGCGPFQNARGKKKDEPDDKLILDKNGKVVKCPKKKLNEANKMAEEIEALKAEFEKQLNASNETIGKLTNTVSELTKKIGDLEGSHKTLNESFQNKQTSEAAEKEAANKGEFKKTLNAAAATESDALWDQVKRMNPVEYEAWKITNSAKLLDPKEAKDTQGKKNLNAANNAARSTYLEAHNKR